MRLLPQSTPNSNGQHVLRRHPKPLSLKRLISWSRRSTPRSIAANGWSPQPKHHPQRRNLGPAVDAHIEPQTSADAPAVDVTPSDHPFLEQQSPSELDSERPQDADVEIEQPPASSRRPLGPEPEEQIARIAFGSDTEEPPRHTPPPESGRLPSPDESDLRAEIDSPGTLDPFEAKTDERPLAARPANPRSPGSRLVVVETRAVLPTDGDVAKVANDASVKEPLSFAELLRASLALWQFFLRESDHGTHRPPGSSSTPGG